MADNRLRELIHRNGIGPVRCNGREVLRRIFVTVRDHQWREIAPTHWESVIDEEQRTATLTARHIGEHVAFEWEGKLRVNDELTALSFAITGQVLRDMEVCRLGLVVLHPVESTIGSRVDAPGQQVGHCLSVPEIISPQPIVNGIPAAMTEPFSKLIIQRPDFGKLEIQFEGDLFELEDQRNWGDTTFKTYCTPLRRGFPRPLKVGEVIAQRVEVDFTRPDSVGNKRPDVRGASNKEARLVATPRLFPGIGRDWRAPSAPLVSARKPPAWHHIHVQIQGHEGVAQLRSVAESPKAARIEIAVEAAGEETPIDDVLALISTHRERIARLLLYGPQTSLPSAKAIQRWRWYADSLGAQRNIPLLAATRGYFVEFNRGIALPASVSGIAFPLTATVHSDEAVTITDNVTAIRDMSDTARHLTGLTDLVVAPLALYYPPLTTRRNFLRELIRPWLAASLIQAALARVTSVTLAEDVLEAVTSNDSDAPQFISGLVEYAGHEVAPLEIALPSGLHAAVFNSVGGGPSRILAANLNPRAAVLCLAEARLRAETAVDAVTEASLPANEAEVEIPGFGITWIEVLRSGELF